MKLDYLTRLDLLYEKKDFEGNPLDLTDICKVFNGHDLLYPYAWMSTYGGYILPVSEEIVVGIDFLQQYEESFLFVLFTAKRLPSLRITYEEACTEWVRVFNPTEDAIMSIRTDDWEDVFYGASFTNFALEATSVVRVPAFGVKLFATNGAIRPMKEAIFVEEKVDPVTLI